MRPLNPPRGVALISALLTVAVATAASASLAITSRIWLRQVESSVGRAQADAFVTGAFDWACATLTAEGRRGGPDALGGGWSRPIGPVEFGPGSMSFSITDAQARFNLNSLARGGVRSDADVEAFRRLLIAQRLDKRLAEAAVARVMAAGPLDGPDDLLGAFGVTQAAVERLRPWVTGLPEATAININTAPREILRALFPDLDDDGLERLLAGRLTKPLRDVPDGADESLIGVGSSYFFVEAAGESCPVRLTSRALIRRPVNGEPAFVMWRSDER